jgi:hypothetical protein
MAGDIKLFQDVYCSHCRSEKCQHARWFNTDKFAQRVSVQADRLLKPKQLEQAHPKHAVLKDFVDMLHTAERLEIADRRGDWEVVPDLILPSNELAADPFVPAPVVAPPSAGTTPPSPAHPPMVAIPAHMGNTEVPSEGIMIGGDPLPRRTPTPSTPVADPWEVTTKVQTVKPGAKIVLGGPKNE